MTGSTPPSGGHRGPMSPDAEELVVIEQPFPVPGSLAVFVATLPAQAQQLSVMRCRLEPWLTEREVPDLLRNNVVLAANEAMTNSVEHAYRDAEPGDMTVRVELHTATVLVTVTDNGTWRPPQDGVGESHGWGMPMVRAIAEHVELAHVDGVTTFSARFRRHAVPPVREDNRPVADRLVEGTATTQ